MRIAKVRLIDQEQNQHYGIFAVALSLFAFAYSTRFGPIAILAYYGLWLPLLFVDHRRVIGDPKRYAWLFVFAIFAIVSAFWSGAPGFSGRTAVQYFTHVVCALIAARTINIRTLTRGMMVGTGIVLVYSLLFGIYLFDALDGTFSFVGEFSSKNQLGFYASLGVYFAFAGVFILRERQIWIALYGVVALLAGYCLIASQSATSVLALAAVLALSVGMRFLGMLSPRHRKIFFTTLVVFGTISAIAALYGGAFELILGAFGKDATLTGRTYLWQQGMEAAAQSPVFGVGYQGFWVPGFSEAERLWDDFFIESRSGFHFHNTYIEAAVETGIIGLGLLCMVLITNVLGHLKHLLARDEDVQSSILFGIAMLLFVRSFVEIDIMTPYQIGSFLLYYSAAKLTIPSRRTTNSAADWPSRRTVAGEVPTARSVRRLAAARDAWNSVGVKRRGYTLSP
ncbi:O-antigen ligase [Sinorhizobium sp. BG8]|uniref:O-antigen ligase family protein n=1 Tax=Sinorhizobium sp. BG8 TaxID=2613773 RepID=UPI00193E0BB9|nr:O-antigen ligase [Sinorhizobium sp. BG8]QRM57354.1 O-antigen ligase family protein [Sinorhizobium sp. BG8]